jgi:hypothetical protein
MAEKEHPAIACPVVKAERSILGFGFEIGGGVANVECHVFNFRFV